MRARTAVIALLVAACGNGSDDTDTPVITETCDTYETTPLPEMQSSEWPAGLDAALAAYKTLDGIFYVPDCADANTEHELKITLPPQEEVQVITGGVPTDVACGCALDPAYRADNEMNPVGILPTIEVFIPDTLEPSGEGRTYEMQGALFGSGQELLLRACAHRTIDPAEESEYDDAYWFLRVAADGTADMTMLLAKLGSNEAPSACDFDELRPQ